MIPIDFDLRDIIISAFRYALGRKTFVTLATCHYFKEHPEIVDKRVKNVLLRDLESIDKYYSDKDPDYYIFNEFKEWLEKMEIK